MTKKTIAEVTVGSRHVAGTDWPVSDLVQRVQSCPYRRPEWVLVRGLCNGVADSSQAFVTRAQALEAFSKRHGKT